MRASVIEAQYPILFRQKEAKKLGEYLRQRQSVNIVGIKRIGISNFLRFFLYHKDIKKTYINDNGSHLFIPVDLHDLVELETYPFWTLTLKRIVDVVEKSDISQSSKNKINSLFLSSIQSQDLFVLIDNVRQAVLLTTGEGLKPTLFFIRFDRMAPVFTASFFDNLKGLRDATHHELTYVFTSYRSLTALFPEAKTSLSVFAQTLYMPPASEADMRIIYEAYNNRYNLRLTPQVENSLFKMVNGNIQYLQLALIVLNEKKHIQFRLKEDLFDSLVHDERITLQSEELWESLTMDEKKILTKINQSENINPEEKEKNIYLWDAGFITTTGKADVLFSPLFEAYLGGCDKNNGKNSTAIHLTKKEHMLYVLLESQLGTICEREKIIEVVWPEYKDLGISDWAIDRLVARVRAKLKQQNSPHEIVTIRTRGYKLASIQD